MGYRVMVLGSGGREHALAYKLAQSPKCDALFIAPGNDGMSEGKFAVRATRIEADLAKGTPEFERLAKIAKQERIDLVVVGPDNALADGVVDVMDAHGVLAFGPTKAAAKLEWSKGFSKDIMQVSNVFTARFARVRTAEAAEALIGKLEWCKNGCVVKADGLALGKGVRICDSQAEAIQASRELIGLSGELVLEEKLKGQEVSVLAFCDGTRAVLMDSSRDHKRLLDQDKGPNTGGMGVISPAPGVSDTFLEQIRQEVFEPILGEMKKRGTPFKGILYAGLMVDLPKYWVLEFNARFGDPETQALLPRMDEDLLDWCLGAAKGELPLGQGVTPYRVKFRKEASVFVVASAAGYPESPKKGDEIKFEKSAPAFFAGAKRGASGNLMTHGGRVLGALGLGHDLETASALAYREISKISFSGMHFRKDLGA